MRRSIAVAVAAAAVACAAAGCGTGAKESAPPGERPKAGTVAISTEKLRDLTVPEEMEIEYAEHALVKECMEDKGFPYWVGPVAGVDARRAGRYVVDDIAWAKKYGYGRPFDEAAEKERQEHPNVRYPNGLPQKERIRYNLALNGDFDDVYQVRTPAGGTIETPRNGCWAEARTRLHGDPETWFKAKKTVTGLTPLYVPDILEDERLVRAVKAWSRCMKESGRPFSSPDEIREKRMALVEGMSSREAMAAEVELAVVEATCAVRTSLGRTARSLENAYLSKTLKKYGKENAVYQRMRLNALAGARALKSR